MENIIFEQFKVDPPLGIKRVLTLAVVHGSSNQTSPGTQIWKKAHQISPSEWRIKSLFVRRLWILTNARGRVYFTGSHRRATTTPPSLSYIFHKLFERYLGPSETSQTNPTTTATNLTLLVRCRTQSPPSPPFCACTCQITPTRSSRTCDTGAKSLRRSSARR